MAEYINRVTAINGLYEADAITMEGVKILNQIPSEDVAPIKHGNWIVNEKQAPKGRKIKYSTKQCSVCGKWNGRHKANYCPHCGAKMDGANNG